jgi:hypothetical protein
MMRTDRNGHIDWTARIIDGWAVFAIGMVSAGCLIGIIVPALRHLFGALTLALTLH